MNKIVVNTHELDAVARRARRVQDGVEQVRGRATSSCGEVSVQVGADGRICELAISEDAVGLGSERMAELISQVHRAALAEADCAARAVRQELAEVPAVARVARTIETTLDVEEPSGRFEATSILHDPLLRRGY
ncbi:YbaB/EbfC family nucleoid-associated protein [Antrihabitans cavernicola]|uniref:YbaB/EbfC family nucleoid-associated protein n=1 Tax=Antrihabitans cavernicola TaxID=2495913 RepID=UPI0016594C83|nr:YbaB/EbfC family nucleoid-associated protein [Spelaeibacter cavernicola]